MKNYVKISGREIPVTIVQEFSDHTWSGRESLEFITQLPYNEVKELFANDMKYAIISETEPETSATGKKFPVKRTETDASEYCLAGPIIDYRDGRVSAKMGKMTDGEMLQKLREAIG